MRIPGILGLVRSIGIDVQAMTRRGLLDFVGPSNFWQTTWDMPHDGLRAELGEDVTICGVVEGGANWVEGWSPELNKSGARYLSASPPLLRGNAAGKLVLGAAGIEQFNFFCTDQARTGEPTPGLHADYGALRGLDDLPALRVVSVELAVKTP